MTNVLAGVISVLAASTAFASDGPYIGLEGGLNILNGQTARQTGSPNGQVSLSTLYDLGQIGGLSMGYAFASGLRPELEFDFRRNDPRKYTPAFALVNTDGIDGARGHTDAYTAMANLWYDVKTGDGLFSRFHPYIGAGVGVARLAVRRNRLLDPRRHSRIDQDGYDTAFAYQGGAGLTYDLTRRMSLGLDYRFLQANNDKNQYVQVRNSRLRRDTLYERYRSHSLLLDVRFSFGSLPKPVPVGTRVDPTYNERPAPDPVPAPSPAVPAAVLLRAIDFQFDRDELTAAATATLDEVVSTLRGQPAIEVRIVGHTDSVGSDAYNLALSQRRANAVLRYLVAHGVDRDHLSAAGMGESQPIASNRIAEGRAENRRTEFVVTASGDVKAITGPATEASKAAALQNDKAP